MNQASVFAVVAGGGTAGHVSPALAIAEALVQRGHDRRSIHYVGSERGIEREMVPPAGFPLTLLPGRGIQRRLTLENLSALWGLATATVRAVRLVRRLAPQVVVSVGGYASVPCAIAARLHRVPVVVAEQNAVAGLANRLVGRWAKACAVSFPATALPRAVLTGNPVRGEIRSLDPAAVRPAARARFHVADTQRLVTVYGGSLGARSVNRAIASAVADLVADDSVVVRHLVGERDWDLAPRPTLDRYEAVRYEHDMASLLAASDLVVCRAGASTVAELAVVGVPAVLVPLPGAPGDHQSANAAAMAAAGAAVVVPDAELDGPRLAAEVTALLADPGRLAAMAAAARAAARPDAADAVAALAEDEARG